MNKSQITKGKKPLLILWIAFLLAGLVPGVVKSQCSAPTMTFHSPVLISGTDGQQGAVYLFQNVLPGVDAHIEVLGL
ncbi:MAG TPA: hypothetical protein VKA49_11905, partial [Flavitalea sp.]|nr:hypothetical protein [Flavitalea sp.]